MNKPLVTIITPAYNCEKYIKQTIDSVIYQDYDSIEYIVIDDNSTDNTWKKIAKVCLLAKTLPLICRHKDNQGEQKTVNELLDMVNGKYFMVVNADDPLLPGAISKLVAFMEDNPDIVCAYPDWETINNDGSHRLFITSREYDYKYMIKHHTCLPSVGSIVRSSVLKTAKRDESYRWLGDFVFWLKVAQAGPMARYPETLARWRHSDGQASGDKSDKRAQEHIRIINEYYSWDNIPEEIIKVKAEARCWSYLVAAAVTDSKLKMLRYVIKAFFVSYLFVAFDIDFWDALIKRAIYILRR